MVTQLHKIPRSIFRPEYSGCHVNLSKCSLFVGFCFLFLLSAASTYGGTMIPQPGFSTQLVEAIGFDESQAGVPFSLFLAPCTTSTCSSGIVLGDIVMCDGPASGCGFIAVNGVLTGYSGPVSDIISLRADPSNPNNVLMTMYSDPGTDSAPEGDGPDVFVNPPLPPTFNFVIIPEAPFGPCPRPGFGANCEDTIYIPVSGSLQSEVGFDIVSDTSLPPPTTTPEPASLLLVGTGLGLAALRRRLR
jgi:hypothetical protein